MATIALLSLLGLNVMLPWTSLGRRGTEALVRADVESHVVLGQPLPELELVGLDGRAYSRGDFLGHRVLLTFERSVDWSPYTKARLVELREVFVATPDLQVVWVMSDIQINDRTRSFIDELGLANRILFLADPKSKLIQELGILKADPEPIEKGVPHPTTLLLDRDGRIRFIDVRTDFHIWLDPAVLVEAVGRLDATPPFS
ncbi:MAG: redoxin domain-containing protein [Myxococcota bacterium]